MTVDAASRTLLDRRAALRLLGLAGLGAVATACGDGSSDSANSSRSTSTSTSAPTTTTTTTTPANATATTCVLTPEMTEGPYFVDGDKVRSDITEGKPGTPLTLALTVMDVATCTPIKDASVDIWHADAVGGYSGFGGSGSNTFLRGIQPTNANGVATFQTIYPGWYTGRTVHIHVKVAVGGSEVHTGQLFFDDDVTDTVYRTSPYSSRSERNVRNAGDSIYRNGGSASLLALTANGSSYTGTLVMGVRRS
jgi:protocatechuate 3,4-dioxygenase beta subunit